MRRPLFALLALLPLTAEAALRDAALVSPAGCSARDWTQVYDGSYRTAWLTRVPLEYARYWCWLKAVGIAESGLDPSAVSPAGARGLNQFMPGTWAEVMQRQGWRGSPHDPMLNIRASAVYMATMIRVWSAPRPGYERLPLASAGYNAGAGHVVEAQRLCRGARSWDGIAPCLRRVTGRHSRETLGYVARIRRLWTDLTGTPWPPS